MKKDSSSDSDNVDDHQEENIFIGISNTKIDHSKTDFVEMDDRIQNAENTLVYFKSPSESYRISRESFPRSLDEVTCDHDDL